MLGSCDFVEEEDGQKFGPHQLRLAIINHFIDYRELLFDEISEEIRLVHGALEDTDSGNGGYSYKSYLEYMMKNKGVVRYYNDKRHCFDVVCEDYSNVCRHILQGAIPS